ncbi:hypothetical protein [Desulfobacca acetoxidans]|uniref:Uncharacterized protein n=1 Tax=Desulfobacca acetoxidans (strain ATCC 700848 / DSM 11109 / ASRB2) TaxID=880072 RepID=F2NG13_DESAR|nr:hypothetical protein [Desulfobacca acetoxidans]AEB08426.1 hypothetical protein Desac_0540 [Desulfobacca acetoxidans DSM 11109]
MPRRRLNTSQDCRRYLANVINRLEAGTLDPNIAGRLAYITNIIIRAIETSELETRLNALEERFSENPKSRLLRLAR